MPPKFSRAYDGESRDVERVKTILSLVHLRPQTFVPENVIRSGKPAKGEIRMQSGLLAHLRPNPLLVRWCSFCCFQFDKEIMKMLYQMHRHIKKSQKALLLQRQFIGFDTYPHVLTIPQVSSHLAHWWCFYYIKRPDYILFSHFTRTLRH